MIMLLIKPRRGLTLVTPGSPGDKGKLDNLRPRRGRTNSLDYSATPSGTLYVRTLCYPQENLGLLMLDPFGDLIRLKHL